MKMLPNSLSSKMGRQILIVQKNSPTILFGVGVAGIVGSTVLACRATLKLETVLEEIQNDVLSARELAQQDDPRYIEKDRDKDLKIIKVKGIGQVVKLYGPSLVLGAASVGALTKSHNILTQRNAALTAAYVAVSEGFDAYRARVVSALGEEQDREFRYGSEQVSVKNVDTGKPEKLTAFPEHANYSIYAKFFDETCPSWSRQGPEYNRLFLNAQQNYANDMLHARGHVFLNDVYDSLGLPRTGAGAVVGWYLSRDNTRGDNYIDFGIYEGIRSAEFINNREGAILLDFNVDGLIYDKIDKKKED